ncbi:MAG: hypothetical protein ACREB8_11155 [Pseudolabrys sp.]
MPHPASILPDAYRPPTRDQIERARDMYVQKFTVSRILAACDMSLGTFYYWLDGGPFLGPTTDKTAVGGDEPGRRMLPAIPRRRVVVGKRRKPLAASHVSLVSRLYRAAERQVFDIEQRLAVPAGATPERERDVRMLALLTRTLRDLSAFGAGEARGAPAREEDDDPVPENIDEVRMELARRIRAFIESWKAGEAAAAAQAQMSSAGEGAR